MMNQDYYTNQSPTFNTPATTVVYNPFYKPTVTNTLGNMSTGFRDMYNNGKIMLNQIGSGIERIPLHDKLNNTMGLVSNFVNAYNSYQATKLANKQFNFSRDAWNRNWEAQKGLTNSRLADRQQRRFNESGGTGMTVSEYMNKYGVK